MSIEITSNGSKWMGESPDSPAQLLEVLANNALDPSFEHATESIDLAIKRLQDAKIALSKAL